MSIVADNYYELISLAKAEATKALGGSAGSDLAGWTDDIAQEVILVLLRKEAAGTLRETELFGLAKVTAWRRAVNFSEKETRRREIEQEQGDAINRTLTGQSAELLAADPLDIMTYEEMKDRLSSLSPLLYNTTKAHYIEGFGVRELADMEGVSDDVIYKRLQRARDIVTGETDA